MTAEELRSLVDTLRAIESIALLGSVSSTNDLARRVVAECAENDIAPPASMLIAREQRSGRGRGSNSWLSPLDGGIYATTITLREKRSIGLLPLEVANLVAQFISDTYRLPARIKWPNDVLIDDRKAAGILIEARFSEEKAFLAIGTGINIRKTGPMYANAISVEEALGREVSLEDAVIRFIHAVDTSLAEPRSPARTLRDWRARSIHAPGERVNVMIGTQRTDAEWIDIDEDGRASVMTSAGMVKIAAGDLIRVDS